MPPTILLTGGAGYIGSHTFVALSQAGYHPVILDNFCNSSREVLNRLQELTGKAVQVEGCDVLDEARVREIALKHRIRAVIHFAGFKAVGESVSQPIKYYQNNVGGLLSLLKALADTDCRNFVFSSSATVYGDAKRVPITEDSPRSFTNPYGHTKLIGEDVLAALAASDPSWQIAVLRYFNPVGAHPSGRIGESPTGIPNNLLPYLTQVAVGQRDALNVFGNDYPTPDGTGVRDFIHVCDLAEGHVAATAHLLAGKKSITVNLGTGTGTSVLQLVQAFEAATGVKVPLRIVGRRPGDVAECYANCDLAWKTLGWKTKRTLTEICEDAWRWQEQNPNGFGAA